MNVTIQSNNEQLERDIDVKILGVLFNEHLSWKSHVNAITKTCYVTLKTLKVLQRVADFRLRKMLMQSLILSKLNYCNVLLADAPQYLIKKLQKIQNAAAGYVYGRRANEIDVVNLKWLTVSENISTSLAKLAHKALNESSWPRYLPLPKALPQERNLRSQTSANNDIDISNTFDGSFVFSAGKSFNELPDNVKSLEEYERFTSKCSSYYFDKATARVLSMNL